MEIPKLMRKNGKYAFFYLGSFEKYRELFPQPIRLSVPTAEMRTGDFSRMRNATGEQVRIYDPLNAPLDASGNPVRSPFPGNLIPGSRIHPVAAAVTKYYQDPNDPGLPNQRYAVGNYSLPSFPTSGISGTGTAAETPSSVTTTGSSSVTPPISTPRRGRSTASWASPASRRTTRSCGATTLTWSTG